MFRRSESYELERRLAEPRRFIQIILGPRQVGKTTLVTQALQQCRKPIVAVSADDLSVTGREWLMAHWQRARSAAAESGGAVLSIDEIQKIPDWSSTVKMLWDQDAATQTNLHVVLTGSSTTLIRKGMSESLAGRFEVLRAGHWTWPEMQQAFDLSFDEYLLIGGYPGPVEFRSKPIRWIEYMRESIIESTLALDVLALERVEKPALLRNLLILGTSLSAQIVSLQKLLGQLQDAGNAATISQYLSMLSDGGLLTGIDKYAATVLRSRASSPKLQSFTPALLSAVLGLPNRGSEIDPTLRGQIVESAVGSHLLSITRGSPVTLSYWREGHHEVDFVLSTPHKRVLLEVKSGGSRGAYTGAVHFRRRHGDAQLIVVGADAVPIENILCSGINDLI